MSTGSLLEKDSYDRSAIRGFGSVVKHSTADPVIASLIPPLQQNLLKQEICTGFSQEKCSRVSVLYTRHVKEPGLPYVVGAQWRIKDLTLGWG